VTVSNLRTIADQTIATIRDCRECGLAEHDVPVVKATSIHEGKHREYYTFTCLQERRSV
jgi:hypothetical protein